MKRWAIVVLAASLLSNSVGLATSYEITKVIDVGPAAWVPFLGPLKWSPDGANLAYISEGKLMLSDTLGNSREVTRLDWPPRRYEWISDHQIAMNFQAVFGRDSMLYRLGIIDINSGDETPVDSYRRTPTSRFAAGNTSYGGPFLTLEGNGFYTKTTYVGGSSRGSFEHISLIPESFGKREDNHVLRLQSDALYMVNLSGKDSVRLISNPFKKSHFPTAINKDQTYVMNDGLVIRLSDSMSVCLDSLAGDPPPGTEGCGFAYFSFNPTGSEVVFNHGCDDGHSYEVDRIGVYDIARGEFTILDTLLGLKNCTTPVYAPNGRMIAFLSEGRLHIVDRRITND